ncbi:hypothetical protein GF385_01255 [Candidatus Dependentiae bacterium]|nr:hypothetical protein [Candidatus Dependentiae bacterium]
MKNITLFILSCLFVVFYSSTQNKFSDNLNKKGPDGVKPLFDIEPSDLEVPTINNLPKNFSEQEKVMQNISEQNVNPNNKIDPNVKKIDIKEQSQDIDIEKVPSTSELLEKGIKSKQALKEIEENSDKQKDEQKDEQKKVESENDIEDSELPKAETVDLSEEKIGVRGNWVKKREWLKDSYKINEEIQNIVLETEKIRDPFQDKFLKIDSELDSFYKNEGFRQGSVKFLFNSINKFLDKKKKEREKKLTKGVTSEEEIKINLLLKDTKILKKEVEQLRLDIKSIDQLDKSLNDRLKKLDEYIKISLDESIKARDMVDEIWYIVDDLKARNIYYQLKGDILQKVKAIKKFLEGTFSSDFDNTLNTVREQIEKVSKEIKELEEKGLIIQNRSERLEQLKLKDLEEKKRVKEEEKLKEKDKPERPKNMTFAQKLYYFFVDLFAKVHSFLSEV